MQATYSALVSGIHHISCCQGFSLFFLASGVQSRTKSNPQPATAPVCLPATAVTNAHVLLALLYKLLQSMWLLLSHPACVFAQAEGLHSELFPCHLQTN